MRKSDISIDSRGCYDKDSNDEITIEISDLLNYIDEYNCRDGQLVLEFYDDYYDGVIYQGLRLRPK